MAAFGTKALALPYSKHKYLDNNNDDTAFKRITLKIDLRNAKTNCTIPRSAWL
jgi:hypothetical protein